ncbi:MAG: hypothetical protein BMS9Abin02_1775 [Anaerolineae bacterium]|nr:MAG: hypothetical protein BMS9Abin02_1775 [Anaerolineae bacterium]
MRPFRKKAVTGPPSQTHTYLNDYEARSSCLGHRRKLHKVAESWHIVANNTKYTYPTEDVLVVYRRKVGMALTSKAKKQAKYFGAKDGKGRDYLS